MAGTSPSPALLTENTAFIQSRRNLTPSPRSCLKWTEINLVPPGLRMGGRSRSESANRGREAIYVANADSKNVTKISEEGPTPSWSPDGAKVAFTGKRDWKHQIC